MTLREIESEAGKVTGCISKAKEIEAGVIEITFKENPDYRNLKQLEERLKVGLGIGICNQKVIFKDENGKEITAESIKNKVASDILSDIEKLNNQFLYQKIDKNLFYQIDSQISNFLEPFKLSGRINKEITVKSSTDSEDNSTVKIAFYYRDKELCLEKPADLLDFDPDNYLYIDNGTVYRSLIPPKPLENVDVRISLTLDSPSRIIKVTSCKDCPYVNPDKRKTFGTCNNMSLNENIDGFKFELKDNFIMEYCPLELEK